MESVWLVAALWLVLALVATLLSIWVSDLDGAFGDRRGNRDTTDFIRFSQKTDDSDEIMNEFNMGLGVEYAVEA